LQLNRVGIGVEISESYCALAVKRLRAVLDQPKLILKEKKG
jgi:DNA modification methylase